MRRGSVFLLTVMGALCVGGIVAWASDIFVSGMWRYKMTVTVETPEGDISGSAVRQMGDNYKVSFPVEASNYGEVMGEAVVVDLGARGVLFVLIDHASDLRFYYAFPEGSETPEGYAYYASLPIGTKAQMPLSSRMPKLVTFTDMSDPKSVTLVYQRSLCREAKPLPEACAADSKGSYASTDRFEELFGEGVKLKDITLEITDEPMTWGVVDQWLHWLDDLRKNKSRLNGSRSIAVMTNDLSDNLGVGSFSRGVTK